MEATAVAGVEKNRRRAAALAYRMLGSVEEAEDGVQDAYLRWHRADRGEVANPGAFLARIVTRLSLDRLKEARRRRETYVGPWLPDPLVTELSLATEPVESVADDISYALLLALERLSPLERAAFLLHDVFDVEFEEVATALGRSPASCRQLASRARSHLREERPRYAVRPDEQRSIADAFFAAVKSGDAAVLGALLAQTATFHSDGGGKLHLLLKCEAHRGVPKYEVNLRCFSSMFLKNYDVEFSILFESVRKQEVRQTLSIV